MYLRGCLGDDAKVISDGLKVGLTCLANPRQGEGTLTYSAIVGMPDTRHKELDLVGRLLLRHFG